MLLTSQLVSDDVRKRCVNDPNDVRKLSPTEPVVVVNLTIGVPVSVPTTRLEKLLKTKYNMKARARITSTVEARVRTPLSELHELLNRIVNLAEDLKREAVNAIVCIDYEVLFSSVNCPCRDRGRYRVVSRHRTLCLDSVEDRHLYVHCNSERKRVVVKYFKQKPVSTVDLLQLTPSVFTHCADVGEISSYVNEVVKYNLELINKYAGVMSALSTE